MTAATTHTVQYEPDLARVRIDLAGFQAGTTAVQVTRRNLDTGRVELVRGARSLAIANPSLDSLRLYDYEFPAGAELAYRYTQGTTDTTVYPMTDVDSGASSAAYDVEGVWLKHALRPYLNRVVTVRGYTPWEHTLRATVYPVVGRNLPIGRGDVRAGRTFTVDLDAATSEVRHALDDFLAVGGVWYWQPPSTDRNLPESAYVIATAASEGAVGRAHSGRRVFTFSLAECAAPAADAAAPGITWQSVVDNYATWADVIAAKTTWAELLSTFLVPAEVVVE